jgi:hypothetical protein
VKNIADVTGGKPIAVLLQCISGVSAINPLVAFYDIHGGKREVLFFCFVPDTTRDYNYQQFRNKFHYVNYSPVRFQRSDAKVFPAPLLLYASICVMHHCMNCDKQFPIRPSGGHEQSPRRPRRGHTAYGQQPVTLYTCSSILALMSLN